MLKTFTEKLLQKTENMNLKTLELQQLIIELETSKKTEANTANIKSELAERIELNSKFSREFLFKLSKIQNHAITIVFIPTTNAFNNYGSRITVDLIFSEDETKELLLNYSAKPPLNTSGQIKARILVADNFTSEQAEKLECVGFNTKEIFETSHA